MLQAYRAYRVSRDGRIESARLLVCASDEEAIVQANQFAAGLDVELWQGDRLVTRVTIGRRS
jgi:hypothetical protein